MKKRRYFTLSLFLTIMASFILLTGCRSARVVTVEKPVIIHDTAFEVKEVHDSTYIDRWHTIIQKGDTIFVTDEVTKIKYVTKTDTAYKVVEKPVVVSKTETVEVKRPLNWWQKTFIGIGVVSLLALLGIVVWKTRKWWSKLI